MKKTNKVKMGPLGTPLGNALGYFNSLKAKTKVEPKQTLRKAQDGQSVYSGPFSEKRTKSLDTKFPSTVTPIGMNPWYNTKSYINTGGNVGDDPVGDEKKERANYENFLRQDSKLKKGGSTKSKMKTSVSVKKMQDGGMFTPNGRLKSKKTRDISLSSYGNSTNVSRTKRNGDIVTKSINTSNGYGGTTADKTKTITNKVGETVSKKTKNISAKSADRKINRVSNNVGRNANDTWAYKKGGLVKKNK